MNPLQHPAGTRPALKGEDTRGFLIQRDRCQRGYGDISFWRKSINDSGSHLDSDAFSKMYNMQSEGLNPYQLISMQMQGLASLLDALSHIYQQTSMHLRDWPPLVLEAGAEWMFNSHLSADPHCNMLSCSTLVNYQHLPLLANLRASLFLVPRHGKSAFPPLIPKKHHYEASHVTQ